MNLELVEYGIKQEDVDIRIHVSFVTNKVYLYKREDMLRIIDRYPIRSAFQKINRLKRETARGHIVPVCVDEIIEIEMPLQIAQKHKCNWIDDETRKGKCALNIVMEMIEMGVIQRQCNEFFQLEANDERDYEMQLKGNDIILTSRLPSIQVKCDYNAGPKAEGGTGNLFIQTHECNPLQKH